MTTIRHVIADIFNYDFAKSKSPSDFAKRFFERELVIADLQKVHNFLHSQSAEIGGKKITSCLMIGAPGKKPPLAIIAQLHGNEPAGLAGILLAMALDEAKLLTKPVLAVIGNPLASEQYFSAFTEVPKARQELRDAYRCGLGEGGVLLPDMNRIPADFMTRDASAHNIRRAQELFHIGNHVSGILDIHSARGNMLCVTDYKHESELKDSTIRSVLVGLAEAISAHSSAGATTVKTLKTILAPLPNIEHQVGIEAGRHEARDTPLYASLFTYNFLHTAGVSKATPIGKKETGIFDCYHVHPKWTYGDLAAQGTFAPEDKIYMAISCMSADAIPKNADRVIVRKKEGGYQVQTIMQYIVQPAGIIEFAVYQYDEMEMLHESAVVAVAVPSGTTLKAPATAAGIFFSKSASLYDKDPSVGPWPLLATARNDIKFCYPCTVKKEKLAV